MTDNVSNGLKGVAKQTQNWTVSAQVNKVFEAIAGDVNYQKILLLQV